MAKTIYNTVKGLITEAGTGFVFDSSSNEENKQVVSPPGESLSSSGGALSETAGTHNGFVILTLDTAQVTLTLNDGLAVGQEKLLISTQQPSHDVLLKNSDTTAVGTITKTNFTDEDAVLCVWNGSAWKLLG